MPVVPAAEGGPLRRRVSDFFFEHPLDARRLVAAGSTIVLVVALGVVAWPRSSDDIPTHLPFVTIPPSTTTTPTEVVVHVAGSVLRPGLYHRPSGDRVADLLDAAGGPLDEADLDRLNLAERLLDGVRIWVPSVEEPLDPLPTPGAGNIPVDLDRGHGRPTRVPDRRRTVVGGGDPRPSWALRPVCIGRRPPSGLRHRPGQVGRPQ